jgi:hypothetical protein
VKDVALTESQAQARRFARCEELTLSLAGSELLSSAPVLIRVCEVDAIVWLLQKAFAMRRCSLACRGGHPESYPIPSYLFGPATAWWHPHPIAGGRLVKDLAVCGRLQLRVSGRHHSNAREMGCLLGCRCAIALRPRYASPWTLAQDDAAAVAACKNWRPIVLGRSVFFVYPLIVRLGLSRRHDEADSKVTQEPQ